LAARRRGSEACNYSIRRADPAWELRFRTKAPARPLTASATPNTRPKTPRIRVEPNPSLRRASWAIVSRYSPIVGRSILVVATVAQNQITKPPQAERIRPKQSRKALLFTTHPRPSVNALHHPTRLRDPAAAGTARASPLSRAPARRGSPPQCRSPAAGPALSVRLPTPAPRPAPGSS